MTSRQSSPRESQLSRVVELPQGRELLVRSVQAEDRPAMQELYEGLDDESRYRRFFSMYRPPPRFFERSVSIADRGGVGLVACTRDRTSLVEDLVAEAHYELVPNGNGEFAITVARRWRGWLGPYLLDALLDEAASRGVTSLEAYILAVNAPMLALVRGRGYVTIPDDDFTTVHVSVATGTGEPRWPPRRAGRRLLIEGGAAHSALAVAASAAGLEVLHCAGPARRGLRCPVLGGGHCPLAAGADAILLGDPDERSEWTLVREFHKGIAHHPPVWVTSHRGRVPLQPNEEAFMGGTSELIDFLRQWSGSHG